MLATRQTTVATLLRLRGVSWRPAPIERGALRIWGSGRFTLSLSRCCSKLLFQLGELLCTFLLASFEPPDLFLETFTLIHMDEEMFRRPLMRMTDLIPR